MIISDVCNTLFYENTTFGFIRFFLLKTGKTTRLNFVNGFSGKSGFWFLLNGVLYRIFKYDLAKKLAIKELKGTPRVELVQWAEKYYNEVLSQKKIITVFERMRELGDNELFLASDSIDLVIEVISRNVGAIGYVSSVMEYDQQMICSGRMSFELKGRKLNAIKNLNIKPEAATVITDNISDAKLVKAASKKIAVSYSSRSDALWNSLGCEILRP